MKIVIVGCTHAGTAAVVNLKELHPESEITIYEKNDNISFLSCGIALNVGKVIKDTKSLFYNSPENLSKLGVVTNMKHEVLDIDFENKMKGKYSDFSIDWNNSECIKITEHTDAGRAKTVLIGNKSLSGVEVRTLFGLKSANFKCEIDGDKVKFSVIGYGHGVGMSQTGADAMAKQGASYTEIINHFYTGIEIVDI